MTKRTLTKSEIENIKILYEKHKSLIKIYKLTGISPEVAKKCLKELFLYEEPTKYKYTVNHNIFNKIDTEEKAYWLGFLCADGHVRKKKHSYELKLKLSNKDLEHLVKFKLFLNSTHRIINSISKVKYPNFVSISENVSLSVYSKQIYEDLINKGCTPKKTYTISKPNIDKKFYADFIRGYFDGDGYVGFNKEKRSKSVVLVSSSKSIIDWINETLNNKIGTSNVNIYIDKQKVYRLYYQNKNDIIKIYNFLYKKKNIFLIRKKIKFDEIILSFKKITVKQINIKNQKMKIWDDITEAAIKTGTKKIDIIKCCEGKLESIKGNKWFF